MPQLLTALPMLVNFANFVPGDILIHQGHADNDIFFILSGSFHVLLNGREVNKRRAGEHVGDMGIVNPSASRAASVIASDQINFLSAKLHLDFILKRVNMASVSHLSEG